VDGENKADGESVHECKDRKAAREKRRRQHDVERQYGRQPRRTLATLDVSAAAMSEPLVGDSQSSGDSNGQRTNT
jgi:hypothetical protein